MTNQHHHSQQQQQQPDSRESYFLKAKSCSMQNLRAINSDGNTFSQSKYSFKIRKK
jgi:hypothetical protein